MKSLRTSAFLFLSFFATVAAHAASDFKVLIDVDNNATTGCSVGTGANRFDGVEHMLTTTVDTVAGRQVVTSVVRQECVGSSFGAPVTVESGGWSAGADAPSNFLIETRIPRSVLGGEGSPRQMHMAFIVNAGAAAETVLRYGGTAITFPLRSDRRRVANGGARAITLDGNGGDWSNIGPLFESGESASNAALRFTGIYAWATGGDLFFRMDVQSQATAPTARNDSYSTTSSTPLTIAAPGVLANDTDPAGKPLTAVLVAPTPDGVLTLDANGGFVFVPNPSAGGTATFRYKASNGQQESNPARVDIAIGASVPPTNVPPVAVDDKYNVPHGGTLSPSAVSGVLKNDTDAENDALTATLVTQPKHGTLTFRTDGSFTYKHDSSNSKTDSFTYHANDANPSNDATVTITIGADIAPVAVADVYATFEGATLNVPAPGVFTNDTDADTPINRWQMIVVTQPAHGSVTPGLGGAFTYVNDSITGVNDSFQYQVSDGIVTSNVVTVTLNVTPVNDAPVFALGGDVTALDTSGPQSTQVVIAANGGAPDESGQVINYIVTNDNNALFSAQPAISNSGVLTFTPIAGQSGVANLTILAHDNGGIANGGVDTSAPQNMRANVEKIPAITSANTTTFVILQAGTFTVTTSGLPKPSIAEVGALPSGVTFVDGTGPNKGTGVLSGTPAAGTGGSYPITFQATNPHGSSPIQNFTLIVNQPPAITSANSTTFTRNQAGTFTVTTSGFPPPALSETGALPAGLNFVDNANGTATLSGTPTAAGGVYSIVVNATNGVGPVVQQTLTITINEAPTITSANSLALQAGVSNPFTVTTSGFPAPSLGETGALPTGVTFVDNGNGTATIGGTAAQGSGGTYTLTITATNVAGSAPQTFTITVCNNITVTAPGVTTATANSFFSQTFTQTGAVGSPTFTTSSTLPAGITLAANGTLSGTATAPGSFPVVVTVTDTLGCTGISGTYTLVVNCQAITVTNPVTTSGVAGSAFSQTFTQTGATSPTFTTSSTLPTGLTLATNGLLSGTPTQTGSFPIVVTVTDGNTCTGVGSTYTLNITCQTITVTNPGVTTGVANAAFSQTFTETGSIGGATFTTASTLPAGLALATTGVLSGTPTQTGSFPIIVTVTDGNNCPGTGSTYTLTITCQTINVSNPVNTAGTASSVFSETFTQTGAIGTATFTTASTLPAGLSLATNGVLSGTPTQTGSFPIVVTVTDSNGCTGTGATYTLVIACQTISVTNPSTTTGTVNTAFSQQFTQTGAIGGATFTTASTLPTGLSLATNGTLAGIPTQNGSFNIVVTVTDGNGCTGISATYTLVIACQTITVTNPVNATGAAGSPFSETFTQTGAFSTAAFTTGGPLPTGLTLAANGVLSGTPTQNGSFPITVTVTDANGCTGVGSTYNLTITCPAITVTNPVNTSGTAGSAFSETFTSAGGVGTMAYTTASTLPTGITLNAGTGVLAGTTTQIGSFPIVVTATDSNNCTGTGSTYTLVIGCQTISVTNPGVNTGTVDAAFSQTFTAGNILGTVTWSETGTLPAGITLNSATGVLSGTPTVQGSFPITVRATDTNTCFTDSAYTLTIACQTITVTNPGVTTGTVSTAFSQSFTQTGAHGTAVFTTSSTLPAGLTLAASGLLSGTPTQSGSFPINVTVTDANGCTGVNATYTLVIGCQVITVTPPAVTTGTTGSPFSQVFTQTGAVGTPVFSTASTLPTGFTLNSSTGQLSGTTNQHTSFSIVVTVTDGNTCTGTSAAYPLTINCQTITVTNPSTTTGTVATFFSQQFTQTGAIGGATFSTASTLPAGLTLHGATGVLDGTPTQSGSFPITVTVTDGNGCTGISATYTLVIACNVITVTSPANNLGTAGSAFSEQFTQTGGNGTIAWSVTGSLPGGITLNTSTGVLAGVTTTTGTFPITVTATDANTCTGTSATYNLTISCQTITVTNPGVNSVAAGAAFDQTFTVTGILGTVTWSSTGTLPTGITLNSTTGHLAGTSTQQGVYNIVVKATDTNLCFGTSNYTLTVTCPVLGVARTGGGSFPAATFNTAYAGQSVVASGGGGSYTYAVTAGALPTGLTLSAAGSFSGAPTQTGTFNFTVTATDTASACTGSQAFSILVKPAAVNDAYGNLVNNTQAVVTGGGTASPATPFVALTGTIIANDLPSGGVAAVAGTVSSTNGTNNVVINADGTFIYTPPVTAVALGSDSFNYSIASDTGGTGTPGTASGTVALTLVGRVWYVKNNAAAGGLGQSQSPFNSTSGFVNGARATPDKPGDIIYIFNGDGTTTNYTSGITLLDNEQLIGEGVALVVSTNTLVPAGTKPSITNSAGDAVTLANTNTVKGLNITGPSANGISGTSKADPTIDTMTIQGAGVGASALVLTSVTGTVNVTNTTISNSPFGLTINNGTAVVNINNTNTINSGAGQRTVQILNRGAGAGTITIGAAINDSGTGITVATNTAGTVIFSGTQTMNTTTNTAVALTTNAGSTITFSGTLAITTTTGSGFVASGGGTLNVSGTSTITTGAATSGLSLSGMTVGGSGVTFNSVTTTGATTGIALTNMNGSVVVNGGTITNGGTGVSLQGATTNLTLAGITITGPTTGISSTTNFGTLTIGSSVNVTGVTALNLTAGAVSGTFANVSSTGGTNGVTLTGVSGAWGATAGSLAGASGATFNLIGGTGTITWAGDIGTSTAGATINVGPNGATSDATAITFTGNVTSSAGTGLVFAKANGNYQFTQANPKNVAITVGGISISNGSSGTFNFNSRTTLTGVPFVVDGTVSAVTALITYTGTATTGAGNFLFDVNTLNTPGTLTVNGATISTTGNGGRGISIQNSSSTAINIAPTTLTMTMRNNDAITLSNNGAASSITISGVVFTASASAPRGAVLKGAGNVTLTGSFDSSVGTGSAITDAIAPNQFTGTLNLVNAAITSGTADAVSLHAGTLNSSGTTSITAAGQALVLNGVALSNGGSMTGITSTAGANGISFTSVTGGPFNVTGGALSGNTTAGFNSTTSTASFTYGGSITNNTVRIASINNAVIGACGTITLSGNLTATAGTGIIVNNCNAGTITFSGGTKSISTAANAAVTLTNNTSAASINFSNGGLQLTTTTATAFNGLTGTITISTGGNNNTISTTSGTALNLVTPAVVGAAGVTFATVSSSAATTAVSLDQIGGNAVTINGGTITAASTRGLDVNGGSGNVTFAASITTSGALASTHSVEVANHTAGTITISGAITDSAGGINLTGNTGSVIAFTGQLTLNTTTNSAFVATGGGTVTTTNAASAITTTTGTAVNIANTTIGAANVVFASINSTGAGSNTAIILNTTGTGTFTCNGGTISNKSNVDAVTLNTTGGLVTLKNMTIQDITKSTDGSDGNDTHSNVDGIHGIQVNGGLTLDTVTIQRISDSGINGSVDGSPATPTVWNGLTLINCNINNTNRFNVAARADAATEGAVYMDGIKGTVSVTGTSFTNAASGLFFATDTSGTLDMTVRGNTFTNLYKEVGTLSIGLFGISVVQQGTLTSLIRIGDTVNETNAALGNTFTNGGDRAAIRIVANTGATGTMKSSTAKNTFTVTDHTSPGQPANNTIYNIPQSGVLLRNMGTGLYESIFAANTFNECMHADGGLGNLSIIAEKGNTEAIVRNNVFNKPWDEPMEIRADGQAGGQNSAQIELTGNSYPDGTVGDASTDLGGQSPYDAIYVQVRNNGRMDFTMHNEGGPLGLTDTSSSHGSASLYVQTTTAGDVLNMFLQNLQGPRGYRLSSSAGTTYNLFRNGSGSGTPQLVLQDNTVRGGGGVDTTNPPAVVTSGTITLSNAAPTLPSIVAP
jgi:VCBS repeat-containing protein